MRFVKRCSLCFAVACFLMATHGLALAQEKKPLVEEELLKPPPAEPAPFPVPAAVAAPVPHGVPAIPSLHYNYYYPNATPGQHVAEIPARLYLCPRPVPPYVGYVYITYPPFQPHEWLWEHARAYYRFHPGGGMTMTSMWWQYEER